MQNSTEILFPSLQPKSHNQNHKGLPGLWWTQNVDILTLKALQESQQRNLLTKFWPRKRLLLCHCCSKIYVQSIRHRTFCPVGMYRSIFLQVLLSLLIYPSTFLVMKLGISWICLGLVFLLYPQLNSLICPHPQHLVRFGSKNCRKNWLVLRKELTLRPKSKVRMLWILLPKNFAASLKTQMLLFALQNTSIKPTQKISLT